MTLKRPNILLIYTDQQRWDALGSNGNRDIRTPHLDSLAEQGVSFDHCFVQHPLCMPSRVSMLSGQYPATLGITEMGVPVPEDLPLLPHLLAPYGYTTACFGKLHFLPHANRDHRAPHPPYGFDQLEVSDEPGVYEDAYRAWVARRAPKELEHLSVGLPPARRVWNEVMEAEDRVPQPLSGPLSGERSDFSGPVPAPTELTHAAFVTERSIDFLERHAARGPFLCVASFYAPHAPWVVPQRFLDLYEPERFVLPRLPDRDLSTDHRFSNERLRAARHGYYAMVSEVDEYVGQLLATLQRLRLERDTVVLFTSDHGEWLGNHFRFGKGYPAQDDVSRVPLIVRFPRSVAPQRRNDTIVEAVDIVPTLLQLAGVQCPRTLQGEPLPFEPGWPYEKTAALTEANGWKALRTRNFRYLVHSDGAERLYDLGTDPNGYDDVSRTPRYSGALNRHRHVLITHLLTRERARQRSWVY